MSRFLVTGGAGFIGSHLCDLLLEYGHHVRVLDNLSTGSVDNLAPHVEFVKGDVCNPAIVRAAMKGMEGCFHLAAIASVAASNERWAQTHRTNLTATINVFEAARDTGKSPVVYASSAAVYGANDDMPLQEDAMKCPLTAYGADKYGCELHAMPALLVHGVPSTGMRFFNVYGPRQDPASPYSGVISIFSRKLANGEPLTIHGDGGQTRDFIFVRDVCRALYAAMARTKDSAQVFNVCTGEEISILDLAEAIAKLTGYTGEFEFGPSRAGDITRSVGDNSAIQTALGVMPETQIADGLRHTVEWMRNNQKAFA